MAIRVIDFNSNHYREMLILRENILRKPLGLSFDADDLKDEHKHIHIGFYDEDKLEGCCMLVPIDSSTVQLRQMAVTSGLQGKGIGRSIMQFAENIARDMGFKKMIMHARKTALGFYKKLEYRQVGEEFSEVNIPHLFLEKQL